MEILLRYLIRAKSAGEFDRWILWLNTQDAGDLEYMQSLAEQYDFIETRPLPIPFDGVCSIHVFFRQCVDDNTVYVRLDDDIVYIERAAIDRLIQFRIANPQYFLVIGNVVNNAVMSYIHQSQGAVGQALGRTDYSCMAELGWKRPDFAHYVHTQFLSQLKCGNVDRFRFPKWVLHDFERVSINCISWLGREFKQFEGRVDRAEEYWLTVPKPRALNRPNCIFGEVLFAHYAFSTQRPELDLTDILRQYEAIAPSQAGATQSSFLSAAA